MSLFNETSEEQQAGASKKGETKPSWLTIGLAALAVGALVSMGSLILNRLGELESQVLELSKRAEEAAEHSESALERAVGAEEAALEAARGRAQAETDRAMAQQEAESAQQEAANAQQDAATARQEAKLAIEEADRIKKEREDELNRLQKALNQIVETRRTALGLVMNLGSDSLRFDFDKATLRPENKELLSRIVGILLTSSDYQVYVYGHTDDVGTESYNMDLSERRAQSVRDYLVEAGISSQIIDMEGFGKTRPLAPGTSEEARAKNRRVEIGIVNSRVNYPRRSSN
jgi:outer membrane protein OmpA-like peptidoglycan-associated protein